MFYYSTSSVVIVTNLFMNPVVGLEIKKCILVMSDFTFNIIVGIIAQIHRTLTFSRLV